VYDRVSPPLVTARTTPSAGPEATVAVSAAGGPALDKRLVQVTAPIKTVGAHSVNVALHPEVDAQVEVEVVAASA